MSRNRRLHIFRHAALAMAALALFTLTLTLTPRHAAARRTTFGDTVKAARLLADWRYDEARTLIERLAKTAPKAAETRYLRAELAFLDGEYQRAIELLEGLPDSTAGDSAGHLRALAASTLSVTRDYARRESSGGHFVIYYPPGKDEILVDLAGEVLEAAYHAIGEDLGYQPSQPIRVEFLSRPRDLARMSPLTEKEIETTGTIALCKYGKLMVVSPRATIFGYPWMDTLVHEYVHYVVSRLSHNQVPIWLHEGLARFQQTRWRKGPDGSLSSMDEHLLATALARRKLISFKEMHPSMAKLPSQEAAALAFAEVFTMVTYLHQRAGYQGIRTMLELTRDGKSAQRAVAEVLDVPWPRVERDWKAYLRGLGLKPSKALASRASSRRIRFDRDGDKKNKGDNVGVDEVASAKARKLARLGGMLRARGMSEAAAVEYEKALAITGPGDPFVAGKLSRTYLELSKYRKAIELARPLAATDENDATAFVTLGLAHQALGQTDKARVALEAALRISPFDPAVRCGLAEVYTGSVAKSGARAGDAARARRERKACQSLQQ